MSTRLTRKPIQISSCIHKKGYETVFVLCDDGSVWTISDWYDTRNARWEKMPNIPPTSVNKTIRKGWSTSHLEVLEKVN